MMTSMFLLPWMWMPPPQQHRLPAALAMFMRYLIVPTLLCILKSVHDSNACCKSNQGCHAAHA